MSADLFRVSPGVPAPYRILELGATASYDGAAFARLSVRAAAARGAGSESVRLLALGDAHDAGDEWGHYRWRVWWEPPSRWRGDVIWPSGASDVSIVRDDTAMDYLSGQRTLFTSEPFVPDRRWVVGRAPLGRIELPTLANRHAVFPLIRPPLPGSEWEFATIAENEVFAGRTIRRVLATRRAGVTLADEEPSGYWQWVDEYECLVDDTLQILLRLTGIADGVPVVAVAADDVSADAPLPTDVFHFVPPAGTRVVHVPGPA